MLKFQRDFLVNGFNFLILIVSILTLKLVAGNFLLREAVVIIITAYCRRVSVCSMNREISLSEIGP